LLSRQLRIYSASIVGVVLLLVGAVSADAAVSPNAAPSAAPCNATGHAAGGHFTLAQAQACAPGAALLASSAPLGSDGTFIVQRGAGYQVVSRSARPVANLKAAANLQAASRCLYGTVTVIDGGGIVDWMGSYLCWNGSVAWAHDVQTNCYFFVPGFFCLGRISGTFGNYTRLAGAWGTFYNLFGIFPMNTGVRLDIQPNGHWWAWSFDCGNPC
jgi:hypothetical protein